VSLAAWQKKKTHHTQSFPRARAHASKHTQNAISSSIIIVIVAAAAAVAAVAVVLGQRRPATTPANQPRQSWYTHKFVHARRGR
jgi:uncharacterized protein HemX